MEPRYRYPTDERPAGCSQLERTDRRSRPPAPDKTATATAAKAATEAPASVMPSVRVGDEEIEFGRLVDAETVLWDRESDCRRVCIAENRKLPYLWVATDPDI